VALGTPSPGAPAPVDDEGIDLRGRPVFRIGRAVDNDLALDDLRVSRHHAEIVPSNGAFEVRDLGSSNGTFVNGHRISSEQVASGDFIGVGGQTLQLLDGRLRLVGDRRTAWFGAVDLVVDVGKGKRILDEVGFALEPSSVLAVVGPSGSGKTTLLNALTGFRPADSGNVVFDGRDLYATYDDLRHRMGLVPQADILHTQLTVRQALSYAAELRFPRDVTDASRAARVQEVMTELNIEERADLRIDRLSGGQRKRVSVGCELLTEPTLLFLDEPTSGLDPGNEVALMQTLRDLARAGRTVVVVTHSVQSLDLCDRLLVLAPGGKLAFYGAPDDALAYFAGFGAGSSYAGMFQALEESRDADWKGRFRADQRFERLVREPLASADLVAVPARPNIDPPPPPTPVGHQLGVLIRRYLAVLRGDRGFAIALAIQAPIFGILFALMFYFNTFLPAEALNASVLVWLVVVGATWLGTSNAIREIVKELPIYRRERALGLSAGAYVMSKVVVLGVITAIQAAVLVPIALVNQTIPAPRPTEEQVLYFMSVGIPEEQARAGVASTGLFLPSIVLPSQVVELIVVAIVVGIASMALGLLVSSMAGTVDRASTLLPIILVTQIIVSAPLFTVPGVVLRTAGYLFSAQWGMAAAASTLDLHTLREPYIYVNERARHPDPAVPIDLAEFDRPTWHHTAPVWVANVGFLAALTVISLGGAWYALRRTDPDLMEGRHRRRRRAPVVATAAPAPAQP
jgi:ABC-type multidrug transport system ATPase subunit